MASKVIGGGAQSHWGWQLKAWRLKSSLNMRSEALRKTKNMIVFGYKRFLKMKKSCFFLGLKAHYTK
jgi:hypothetical protein